MNRMRQRLALATTAIALAIAASGYAGDRAAAAEKAHALQAKLEYCKTCHGLSAEGYRGYFVIPRLAGQQRTYVENQLHAFVERRRLNPIMFKVAHGIPPDMIGAIAAHFNSLQSAPFGGAPNASLALGKSIFDVGLPESNVPACSVCHGPDAKGQYQIPRLAGQLYWYTVKALTNWSKERGQGAVRDTSAIMVPTTHNLTSAQISAIAAYVSTLR